MAKNSMIPRIRFKGFTDAWEQCKLGDVATEMIWIGHTPTKSIFEASHIINSER